MGSQYFQTVFEIRILTLFFSFVIMEDKIIIV